MLTEVTVIAVNYKTSSLIRSCIESLRHHYPDISVVVVDNGSDDDSTAYVASLQDDASYTVMLNEFNVGHGPALHQAILHHVITPYFFTLDSDCTIERDGFIEKMAEQLRTDDLYAIGWLRWVNSNGVAYKGEPRDKTHLTPYIHPSSGLYDRAKYLTLPPFDHRGAPARDNMRIAHERGFRMAAFPIHDYVTHLKAGTRRMYGGRWNPVPGEQPGAWIADKSYPI